MQYFFGMNFSVELKGSSLFRRRAGLLQLRGFRLGFLQDRDVGVYVFPEGEERYCGKPMRFSRSM